MPHKDLLDVLSTTASGGEADCRGVADISAAGVFAFTTFTGTMPIDRAISTAGGIAWSEVDEHLMLRHLPGTFVAGEMLDWEAPTGGDLLQASFSKRAATSGPTSSPAPECTSTPRTKRRTHEHSHDAPGMNDGSAFVP